MHLACALARNIDGRVVLLQLVPVNNPGLLGWNTHVPTPQQRHQIMTYAAIAADYDIEFYVQSMQFVTLTHALAQAVEHNKSCMLFAHIPQSKIPFRYQFQRWSLGRMLHDCQLCCLDESVTDELTVLPQVAWKQS